MVVNPYFFASQPTIFVSEVNIIRVTIRKRDFDSDCFHFPKVHHGPGSDDDEDYEEEEKVNDWAQSSIQNRVRKSIPY